MSERVGSAAQYGDEASKNRDWRSRALRRLYVGQGVTAAVEGLFLVWLTLAVFDIQGPGGSTGAVLAAAAIPRVLLILPAGVLVDRFDPAVVAAVAGWARAVLLTALALLVALGTPALTTITVVAVLLGAVDAAFFPAALALLPTVAAPAQLGRANAVVQGAESAGDLVGPAVAAGAVALVGLAATVGGLAGLAVIAAVALTALTALRSHWASRPGAGAPGEPVDGSEVGRLGGVREIVEGLRHAWRVPLVRATLLVLAVLNLAVAGPVLVGTAALAAGRWGDTTVVGIVFSGFGAGSLLGLLVAARRPPRRRGLVMIVSVVIIGFGTAALAFAPNAWIAAATAAVIGLGSAFLGVIMVATLQEQTPAPMRGRVMSLAVLATVAVDPLSFALAGALLPLGATALFLTCGAVVVLSAALLAGSPAVRLLR